MEEKVVLNKEKIFVDEGIYESKYFTVHQDYEIAIPGFYIVAPKRKMKSLIEFTEEESIEYIGVIRKVRKAMLEALDIKIVYFFQNEDTPWNFHLWM